MFKLPRLPFDSEKGIAPIFILFLLVVAIIGGTFLVQNRTNINPFAAESSECEKRIDNEVCVKSGVKSSEYIPPTNIPVGIGRVMSNKSLCGESQCSELTNSYCIQGVSMPSQNVKYLCAQSEEVDPSIIDYIDDSSVHKNTHHNAKVTVVDNKECQNVCTGGNKCIVISYADKRSSGDVRNLFNYLCYPTDKIKQIPSAIRNSVFVAASESNPTVSANPNPCVIAAGQTTCKVTLNWDSKGTQNVEMVFHSGATPDFANRLDNKLTMKGTEERAVNAGEYTLLLRKNDGTTLASTKVTVQAAGGTASTDVPVFTTTKVKDANAEGVKQYTSTDVNINKEGNKGVKCEGNKLKGIKADNSLSREDLVDCNGTTPASSCGKSADGKYGCFTGTSTTQPAATQPTAKSPASDYSQFTTKENCERAIATKTTYCTDAGRLVNEKTVWQTDPADGKEKCMGKQTDVRACTTTDEYKNGDKYGVPAGQAASGIAGSNKPIVDGKISPELEKLAEECGMVQDGENTLGIPFFKIGPGQNVSINREDCKQLLATQLSYFQQANIRALEKLKDAAKTKNLAVQGTADGGYKVVPLDESKPVDEAEKKKMEESLAKVNDTNKSIKECQGKSAEEQGQCIAETQKKAEASAQTGNAAAIEGSKKKMEMVLSGNLPEGKEEMCVKADIGVAPFMDAQGIKRKNTGEEHRLLVCRKKGEAKIKWRVLVGGLATGESVTRTDEEGKTKTFSNEKGTDDSDACGAGKDCGNDAERLLKLHPTGSGDPVFTPPVVINTCVSIDSNEPEKVRKILAPYLNASGGKAAGCERTPRKPDTPEAGTPPTGGTPANPANPAKPAEGGAIDYTGVSRETDGCSADGKWVTKKGKNDFDCSKRNNKTCAKGEGDRYGCR